MAKLHTLQIEDFDLGFSIRDINGAVVNGAVGYSFDIFEFSVFPLTGILDIIRLKLSYEKVMKLTANQSQDLVYHH